MSGTRSKKFRPKPSGAASASVRRRSGVLWMLPALGLALAVVIVLALVAHHRASGPPAGSSARDSGSVPAEVTQGLTGIPLRTFDAAAARGALRPSLVAPRRQSPGPAAVLYIGAEYCPYCAALRWPLVVAMARFGSLTGLALSRSSATDVFPGTPTFTFLNARYQSPNVTLQTVELQGNVADATGRYPLLQRPTPTQAAVLRRYDPQGEIPFLLVGGEYLWIGAPFSPDLLRGDWHTIAAALPSGRGAAAQAILGAANEIAAGVCAVNGNSPAAVCHTTGVQEAAQTLPTAGPR